MHKTEVTLHVFQLIDIRTELSLELRRLLFQSVALIMADYLCVDPQRDIATDLSDRRMILDMCRQARESYATWCNA